MDFKDFLKNFAEQFDEVDANLLNENTEFKNLAEWNSLVALSVIAMVDDEYDVILKGNDITNSKTIGELFQIINERM